MLQHIPIPILPIPPSWFPGHMNQFQRQLPALLKQTDVVLELRDARLPLTSINRTFEGVLAVLLISLLQSGYDAQGIILAKRSLNCGERVPWCPLYSAAVQCFISYWCRTVRANLRRWYRSALIFRVTSNFPAIVNIGSDPFTCPYTPSLSAPTKPLGLQLTYTPRGLAKMEKRACEPCRLNRRSH